MPVDSAGVECVFDTDGAADTDDLITRFEKDGKNYITAKLRSFSGLVLNKKTRRKKINLREI